LGDACHDEAAYHLTAAINSDAFSSKIMRQTHDDLTVVRQDVA
jgi:hypothetical protein